MALQEQFILGKQATPNSLSILTKTIPNVPAALLKPLLKLTADIILKVPLPPRALEKIGKTGNIENLEQVLSGLLTLLQALLRQKTDTVKESDLRQLLENLKFPDDSLNEFMEYYGENKSQLYMSRLKKWNSLHFLKLKRMEWRIDISISTSYLSKSLDTIIIVQMFFNNGESRSFEISLSKFHLLRLHVASLLKEFQISEKRSALKI